MDRRKRQMWIRGRIVLLDTFRWKLLRSIKRRKIVLINGRAVFFRKMSNDRLALSGNALYVGLSTPCKSTVWVSVEVTAKMIGYLPNSLQLVASKSEFLKEEVRV